MDPPRKHEKIKLVEINSYLTCYLCKGYLIDATTISECLHSFCRSCIIKFLQENCYCPVCEVIINKAKPCLKLDKTLQDIVYKLVPGLFVKEMHRRKKFYQERPELAPKVSPEARGEDTERTIFNPQDAISLSIEYISDDSAPGAIPSLSQQKNGGGGNAATTDDTLDNPMKRYLQCPGMCRIDVLKKFVRNKYNVDTNLFHIDILYKRVPLPDHYTLIDIGYIYSWKRNEPMKFFFRITDINKVTERFDYFDGASKVTPQVCRKPPKSKIKTEKKKEEVSKKEPSQAKIEETNKEEVKSAITVNKSDTDEVLLKPKIPEELKSKIQNEPGDAKKSVYTNITLNREENVEIITKIQKVSNKEGQPIGLNIINHTVKKNKVQSNNNNNNNSAPKEPVPSSASPRKEEIITKSKTEEDLEKSNFLKSIELTAKSSLIQKQLEKKATFAPTVTSTPCSSSSSSQKRKNSSPVKNEKRQKTDKKPMKIIIQPKSIQNPAVRQMVTNVNQNVNNMSKIVETTTKSSDLQSLIDNCKLNIPASLSITLNKEGEGGARTPPSIPPVKNFIEILKLPEKESKNKEDKNKNNIPTFQNIFEESIKKSPETKEGKPLDLTKEETPKRKILEIASQLKKTKMEVAKKEDLKISIPKLPAHRTLKPPPPSRPQTSATLHSTSLGLNYTVSVGQAQKSEASGSSNKKNGILASPKSLSSSQLLEKYNIQNLAQLTASFNFNPASYGALQHAMLLKQMGHHGWLNQGPLLQYEKYLQSLSAQSKLMGNIKEN